MSAIANAFHILEVVTKNQDTGLTFQNIIQLVKLPKSSAHRMLKELTRIGYLIYNDQNKKYRGGLKLSLLGAAVVENIDLHSLTLPFLQQLNKTTSHNCHLGLLDGKHGVYIHKIESKEHGIRLYSEVGKSFPLHCTAMGKAILAFLPKPIVSKILKGKLQAYTEKTITNASSIKKHLKKVREAGYAIDNEEITRGLICVAAPIFDHTGKVIAAVSTTFPSFIEKEKGIDMELSAVIHCKEQINMTLTGHSGYQPID